MLTLEQRFSNITFNLFSFKETNIRAETFLLS